MYAELNDRDIDQPRQRMALPTQLVEQIQQARIDGEYERILKEETDEIINALICEYSVRDVQDKYILKIGALVSEWKMLCNSGKDHMAVELQNQVGTLILRQINSSVTNMAKEAVE